MSVPALTLWSFFLLLFPAVTQWGEKRYQPLRWVGAMSICYLSGLLIGNMPGIPIPAELLNTVTEVSVSLAIPAMLFTAHPRQLLSGSRQTLLAFGFASLAAAMGAMAAYFLAGHTIENSAEVSGMLASVYTGGTPNMSAVGIALGVEHELFLVLNSADILLSGLYFAFLLTVGPVLLRFILPNATSQYENSSSQDWSPEHKPALKDLLKTLLLSVLLLAAAAGLCFLFFEKLVVPVFILLLTAFSLAAASTRSVQQIRGTYNIAHYLLLIFALSIGSQANFSTLLTLTAAVLPYCTIVISVTLVLHYTFCRLAGLDRNITIIASTAAVFGPPFVGPVAERLKAPHLILSGMLLGMLGYAIGNFVGIGLARLLPLFQ
ncbi:DUF819 family protein [Cesiribacter sp. SM1]|uniref:DUF819 family protein n=1 Tax=Cesiribacter sp. SM1 TaxID=2861196 RepID=UPI001CD672F9|nr:DUF819 family protein [Cesiribacter sp. SM1]